MQSDATYQVHVERHRFHLTAGAGWDGSDRAAPTDGLVSLIGPGGIGVSTGVATGVAAVRAIVHDGDPGHPEPRWAAVSESEIVADDHGLQLSGWDGARAARVLDRPGLFRVRVSAREGEAETYRIDLWPAPENLGLRTLRPTTPPATSPTTAVGSPAIRSDAATSGAPNTSAGESVARLPAAVEAAAGRALLSLTADHDDAPHADTLLPALPLAPGLPPVRVTRSRRFPAPAADLSELLARAAFPALHDALDDLLAVAYAPDPRVAARADDETLLRVRPFAATALPVPKVTLEADGEAGCVVRLSAEKVPGGSSPAVGDVYDWLLTRVPGGRSSGTPASAPGAA